MKLGQSSRRSVQGILASLVVLLAALIGPAAPAQAAPVSNFYVCHTIFCDDYAYGTITWYNRTAYVSGDVWTSGAYLSYVDSTQVVFEAYAGSTKIESQTRTVSYPPDTYRHFGFTIGDPDLVGGIDRIKITVCVFWPERDCGTSVNYNKGDAVEP